MGDPGRRSFQVLKREHPPHGIEPRMKTGNPRDAMTMEMESTNQLASKNLDYSLRD